MPDSKGMSLVEVMIALVILLIVSLALTQSALLGFRENTRNALREEAVRIADQIVGDLRARAFTQAVTDPLLSAGTTTATVTRNFRRSSANFSTTTSIVDISPNNKQLSVEVDWTFKGSNYKHVTNAILGKK